MLADVLPEVFELASWDQIRLDVVSDGYFSLVELVVILIGAYLFLRIHINLCDGVGKGLLDLGCRVGVMTIRPIEDHVYEFLVSTPNRVTFCQADDALDLQVEAGHEAVHLEGNIAEYLVLKGIPDSVLHYDVFVVEVLHR